MIAILSTGAGCHKMNGECASLTVGFVWRCVVKGLTVVDHSASSGQIDDGGLVGVHVVARIEEGLGAFRWLMLDGVEVRSGYDVHGAVFAIHVIQREPAADEVDGHTAPVGVVLVPEDRVSVVSGLEEGLIVEELDVGAEEVLDDVEDPIIVEELSKQQTSFAHLCDLQHLAVGACLFLDAVGVVDGQVTILSCVPGFVEQAIVLSAQCFDDVIVEQLSDGKVAVRVESGYLVRAQSSG